MEKQVEEILDLSLYIAHGKSAMKPGKGKSVHAGKTVLHQKKLRAQPAMTMTCATLQEQIVVAQAVMGEPVRRESEGMSVKPQKLPNNAAMIRHIGDLPISLCQGCPHLIKKGHPTYDLVLRNVGDREYQSRQRGLMMKRCGD